ncbi:hypothetical protein IAT40_002397 [Kwoniella sp. CBS 6097]
MSQSDQSNKLEQGVGGDASSATTPAATRTTGRTRVKSQRVLEAEDTKRFLKTQADASKETPASEHSNPASSSKTKGKGRKKEEETYCICKTDTDGPMIECGECNDWFHFSCIGMTDDEAEKIHKYVCPGCESTTGGKSTHTYDIQTFPSPSPPPGIAPAKRKQPSKAKAKPSSTPDAADDGDFESTKEASSSHSSPRPSPPKRPRPSSIDTKRKSSIDVKPSTPPLTGTGTGLPPMRKYVREKLGLALKGLLVDMDDDEAGKFAAKVEEGIYQNFKEVVGGKETAGTRYKTQFNLLSSSMAKGLRPDLAKSIQDGSLTPAQIATLTSADLASAEQLAELERVKQAVLEQTVRAKEEVASIRMGRDGFEKVENTHEKEMKLLAEQEEVARARAEEAAKKALEPAEPVEMKSPVVPDVPRFAPRRSESTDLAAASPLRQTSLSLSSAWGKDIDMTEGEQTDEPIFSGDQNDVDLSDIVAPDVDLTDLLDEGVPEEEAAPSEMELFEAKPVVWSGGIVNPANPSTFIPPMSLRVVCKAPALDYSILLPRRTIEITGRVPTKDSLQFLSDSRLNPTKELVTVVFTLDAKANDEEATTWEEMIAYHIGRDRHAIYLPYGNKGRVPPGGAKELYMIPLRPSDPSPDITDLIDGYSLPATGRTSSVFLGVFVSNKASPQPAPVPAPSNRSAIPVAAPGPTPPIPPTTAPAASPVIQNEQLAALMASLNPTTLQGVLGGVSPAPAPGFGAMPTPPPLQGGTTPMPPPPSYPPYLPQEYSPYQTEGGYTPSAPYQPPSQPREDWRPRPPRDPRRDRRWK